MNFELIGLMIFAVAIVGLIILNLRANPARVTQVRVWGATAVRSALAFARRTYRQAKLAARAAQLRALHVVRRIRRRLSLAVQSTKEHAMITFRKIRVRLLLAKRNIRGWITRARQVFPTFVKKVKGRFMSGLHKFRKWLGYKKPSSKMRSSILDHLSPREVRRIASSYQLKVTGWAGNWSRKAPIKSSGRLAFFVFFALMPPAMLLYGAQITAPAGFFLLMALWSFVVLWCLWKIFMVNTPKLGAIITRNIFTGRMHVFKPGMGIRYPWEDFDYAADNISQRAKKVNKESTFLTAGVPVTFKWTAQWGPFLPLLPLNIRFDEGDVEEAVTEIVENTISEQALGLKPSDVLDPEKVMDIQKHLLLAIEGAEGKERHCDAFGNSIEERVGANMEISTLGPPDFEKSYKEALIISNTVAMMTAKAKEMATALDLEGGEAFNNVMLLNDKTDVKKNIVEIQVGKRAREVAEHLGRAMAAAETIASRVPTAEVKGAST